MVRKGNKYLDLVLKWCEKCQRRRELLTVGGSIVGMDEVQSLVVMFGVFLSVKSDQAQYSNLMTKTNDGV